ncbi:LysM peptidoglycan-binding domain-containing protein [Patescibacteria group bacterium]
MNDRIQRFFSNALKYRKLLLAAVILISISIAILSPIKGIEYFLLLINNKGNIAETRIEDKTIHNIFSNNELYLAANSLACISDLSSDSNNNTNISANNDSSLIIIQKNAILTQSNPITFVSQKPREEITSYTVQSGDTAISIAASYGITTNTLLWANKLNASSIIRPGDELTIPPVSGVIHRIKSGETISEIANFYNAKSKDIIAFNDLPADGETISIGQKIIVPDGQMPAPKQIQTYNSGSYASITGPGTGKSRSFPWGQCTWYVAQKRIVPWSGHAKSWLVNSRAYGYETGSNPQAGAIMVLDEGGWMGRLYGHVAYVESVGNGWVTISEMNYRCLGCKSVRTISIYDKRIEGYIY